MVGLQVPGLRADFDDGGTGRAGRGAAEGRTPEAVETLGGVLSRDRCGVVDAALLSAALAGDVQAVGAVYDDHAGPLYRLAACLLGSTAAAEDVVVDVLGQACTVPGAVEVGEQSLRSALVQFTYRRCRELGPASRPTGQFKPGGGAPSRPVR